ncbi:hypothetical protein SPURM210S_04880 [Streptomyces purpurascens]
MARARPGPPARRVRPHRRRRGRRPRCRPSCNGLQRARQVVGDGRRAYGLAAGRHEFQAPAVSRRPAARVRRRAPAEGLYTRPRSRLRVRSHSFSARISGSTPLAWLERRSPLSGAGPGWPDPGDEPLVVQPVRVRSSSARRLHEVGAPPRSAASCRASRTRSSLSMNCCTYSVGRPARPRAAPLRPTTSQFGACPWRAGPWRGLGRGATWPVRRAAWRAPCARLGGRRPLAFQAPCCLPPLPTCAPFLPDTAGVVAAMSYPSP